MRRSYVDTLLRHKALCIAPVVIATGLGITAGLTRPPDYVATAAIFADAPLLEASTIGTTGGLAPPSAGQAALMSNFLATRSFRLTVARKSGLAGFEDTRPPVQLEKSLASLAASITTTTPGPNVLVVAVTQPKAGAATGVAKAVVTEFLRLEHDTIQRRATAMQADARDKVAAASDAIDSAQRALSTYLSTHPAAQGASDVQAGLLRGAVSRAQTQYTEVVRALQDPAAGVPSVDDSNLFVMDRPDAAYPKSRLKKVVLGAAGGLLAGLALAVAALMLLVARDTTVRAERDLREDVGLDVVGAIGVLPRTRRHRLRAAPTPPELVAVPQGRAKAAFNGGGLDNGSLPPAELDWVPEAVLGPCRSVLRRLNNDRVGSLGVVGTARGDGCTTVALGAALVERNDYDRRTILLELDFMNPSLAAILGLPSPVGLAEVLRGEARLEEAIQWPDEYLGILVAGEVDNPGALLSGFRRSSVLSDLNARGYCVVADLPPLPPYGRGDRVADMFWNVVLVVRSGVTPLHVAQEAVASLATPPAGILNFAEAAAAGRGRSLPVA